MFVGVDDVIGVETTDVAAAKAPSGSRSDREPAAAASSEPARFRVVHTSGETLVASEAEAKELLARLPGARVYCAAALQH
jgi:hypothetical protein